MFLRRLALLAILTTTTSHQALQGISPQDLRDQINSLVSKKFLSSAEGEILTDKWTREVIAASDQATIDAIEERFYTDLLKIVRNTHSPVPPQETAASQEIVFLDVATNIPPSMLPTSKEASVAPSPVRSSIPSRLTSVTMSLPDFASPSPTEKATPSPVIMSPITIYPQPAIQKWGPSPSHLPDTSPVVARYRHTNHFMHVLPSNDESFIMYITELWREGKLSLSLYNHFRLAVDYMRETLLLNILRSELNYTIRDLATNQVLSTDLCEHFGYFINFYAAYYPAVAHISNMIKCTVNIYKCSPAQLHQLKTTFYPIVQEHLLTGQPRPTEALYSNLLTTLAEINVNHNAVTAYKQIAAKR